MKKLINPWRNHPEYDCFGCCPENPIGLHMEFYEDGDYIISTWHPSTHYQGWVNTMHGGILSTLIGARADNQSQSHETSTEPCPYQCRDNQFEG